ncbi:unnamed protein product [Nostoc sp. NIES-3756]|uniref:hypothetical protein n=1 Tax=Nostoc sp. NIES-3756 TaxID=1751286 RepID=UPI00071F3CEF|nr:hypothetical protein [Nostoc sp. NIES-3756]BAT53779.1 unnamed protein product [Nostoc sp. NIES-3756]
MSLPPTTQSGKEVLQSLSSLSKELKYYADGFKATRKLKSTIAEIDQIKKGVKTATQSTKQLEKQFKGTQKVVDVLNKDVKKVFQEFFNKVGGIAKAGSIVSDSSKALAKFAPILTAIAAVGIGIAVNQIQGWRADQGEKGMAQLSADLSKVLGKLNEYRGQILNANKAIEKVNRDVDSLSIKYAPLKAEVKEAAKKANDSLYEVRAGRQILESKVAEARKLGNDALYEVRQGKAKIDAQVSQQLQGFNQQVNSLKSQFQTTVNSVSTGFQATLSNTVGNLQREIASLKNNQVNRPDISREIDTKVKTSSDYLQRLITPVQSTVNTIQSSVNDIVKTGVTTKIYDGVVKSLRDTYDKSFESQARKWNEEQTRISDEFLQQLKEGKATQNIIQKGIKEVDDVVNKFRKETEDWNKRLMRSEQEIKESKKVVEEVKTQVPPGINQDINELRKEINDVEERLKKALPPLETRINEIEKMDKEANRKLDSLIPKLDSIIPTIAGIPLIPGRVINGIKPSIPTIPQIEQATGTAMCRNLKTGCGKQSIDDAVGNILNNSNNNTGSLLDKLNTGLNAADLAQNTAMLNTINNKLGDQVPGGISGKLNRIAKWLQLDKVLNVLTFAATVHNALMLSNDIGVTLGQILSNILQVIGIKDEEGNSIDIGQIINSSVADFIKTIVGESNYQTISEAWAKANRIYQAGANVLNNLMNVNSVITNALEVIGSYTGKVGNALRAWGVVGETAYNWMNPQPSFDNKWITKLQQLQQTASTVQMVSQIPIDATNAVTELTNAGTEFVKAVKQEPDTKDGIDVGEAAKVKEKTEAAKAVSIPLDFDFSDLFDGEDS